MSAGDKSGLVSAVVFNGINKVCGDLLVSWRRSSAMSEVLVIRLSKKQTSTETSSFGPEFAALKQAAEMVIGLRGESRMSGVPLDGPTHMRCDNQSVVTNVSVPASALKRENNAAASHFVRESAAAGVIDAHKGPGETNLADALSETQPWRTRQGLCPMSMCRHRSSRSPFNCTAVVNAPNVKESA